MDSRMRTTNGTAQLGTRLPKLKTAQNACSPPRRDSLSSSRTGDSGYNSDPDISLSPLEFGAPESPYTSSNFIFDSSALLQVKEAVSHKPKYGKEPTTLTFFKKHKNLQKSLLPPKVDIIKCPTSCPEVADHQSKPDWTNAFKNDTPAQVASLEVSSSRDEDVEQWITRNLRPQDLSEKRKQSITSLSSTGSCDMYSTGDNSEDEETLDATPSTLSKATLTTIELIMRKIELNLSYAAYIQCAGSHSSRAQGSASTRGSGGRPQTNNGKRKSRLDDHLPPDDPDDDGTNKRRRISITTTTEDSESGPRFACPFFKHDPNRYRNRRTCPGPGWPTVHRMKEHLYRSHAQPIFCPRCYAMFDSDNEFSNHLRGIPCQISVPQPIEGIDRETLKGLRKRSPALRLEEDKWRDTYLLLFPDVGANDIPSPYYDTDTPTEESRRFRRELLERVRQELFATAEREPGPVEQRLLRQVAGIIQRCEGELLASFYAEEGNNAHPLMPANPSPRPSGPTTQDHPVSASPRRPSFRTAPFAQGSTVPTVQTQHVEPPMSPRSVPVLQPPVQRQQEQPQQQQQQHPLDEDAEMTGGQQGQLLGVGYTDFSSDWIDWNAIFPPGVGSERAVSTPVWT